MASQISAGETFTNTSPNNSVTHTRLNNHVNGATILAGAISEQTDLAATGPTDEVLVNKGGVLYRANLVNLLPPEAVTSQSALATPDVDADKLLISDADASSELKYITPANLVAPTIVSGKTAITVTEATDRLLIWDATDSLLKHVTPSNVLPAASVTSAKLASGMVAQVATGVFTTATAALTTVIPFDDSIPTNTEGTEVMTLAITPKASGNTLLFRVSVPVSCSSATPQVIAAVFQDTDAAALAAAAIGIAVANEFNQIIIEGSVASTGTTATTLKLRVGPSSAANVYVNGSTTAPSGRKFGGVSKVVFTITEINA